MSPVTVERQGPVTRITLDQPERANALSAALVEALIVTIDEAIAERTRLLVLAGHGRSFCGGFDLSTLDDETDASLAYRFLRIEQLLQRIHYAPCYTVALAHGTIAGAGADLVAACARRIATPDSRFRFPGLQFGVVLGTGRLMQLTGSRARNLVLEQQTIPADEALDIGLVDTVATPEQWPELIATLSERATLLPAVAARRVMQFDRATGERDLGILARSVSEPGLKTRMQGYWQQTRKPRRTERASI